MISAENLLKITIFEIGAFVEIGESAIKFAQEIGLAKIADFCSDCKNETKMIKKQQFYVSMPHML